MSGEPGGDPHFEGAREPRAFYTNLFLKQPSAAPVREGLVLRTPDRLTQAVRAMQRDRRGCGWVAGEGCRYSKLVGIFTERDMLLQIVDRGENPATLPVTTREGA